MRKIMCCLTLVMVVFMLLGFSTGVVQAGKCELPYFDASNFLTQEDNPYLSKGNIGYTYVYEAETEDGLIRDYQWFYTPLPADPHATILGVDITVVYDVEYLWVEDHPGGAQWVKLEETWDWHAWDYLGNFWYFGEDTIEYLYEDNWDPADPPTSTEGAWEAGVDGAEPGIILLADPHPGDCVQQEYYEDEAEDMGKVLRLNARVSIDYGDYEKCEVTKEFTPLDPGNVEHKYYCRVGDGDEDEFALGLVYIEELKGKTVIFELVDYFMGSPPATPPSPSP